MVLSKRNLTTLAARSSSRQPRRKIIFEPEPQGSSRRNPPSYRISQRRPPARRLTLDNCVSPSSMSSSPRRSSDVSESEREELDPRNFDSLLIYNKDYQSLTPAEKSAFTRKANRWKKRWDDFIPIRTYQKKRNPLNNKDRQQTKEEYREEFISDVYKEEELLNDYQTIRDKIAKRAEQARAELIKYRVIVIVRDLSMRFGKILYKDILGHYTLGEFDTQAFDTLVAIEVQKGNYQSDTITCDGLLLNY